MLTCNLNITKKTHPTDPINIKKKQKYDPFHNNSSNPQKPNSPPQNTPPNMNVLRELYLSYVSNMTKTE